MNKLTFIFSLFLLTVGLFSPTFSFAQTDKAQSEASYEVVLQILTASNAQGEKANLPTGLSNAVKRLKTDYAFSNYHLTATYLQRIANTGSLEFKTLVYETVPNLQTNAPIFMEWTIGQLMSLPNEKGQSSMQIRGFRFGQRIPITVGYAKADDKNSTPLINYEQIGLSVQKLSLPENIPTVIGTLSTSKTDELMFLILTVKSTE